MPPQPHRPLGALAMLLAILSFPAVASAQSILPPGATVHDRTIGEWTQGWWNWALSFPVVPPHGDEPLTDTTGEHANLGQSGPVFFMNAAAGPIYSTPATRIFTVPGDVHLLVALVDFLFVASGGEACEDIAPLVESAVDGVSSLFLEIDGVVTPEAGQ